MKDPMYWLALIMAIVPFIEQATSDPFVTSRPWLAAVLAGSVALIRFASKWYAANEAKKKLEEARKKLDEESKKLDEEEKKLDESDKPKIVTVK